MALTPLVLQNESVLRRLARGPVMAISTLATDTGRDASNLSKSVATLEREGLVDGWSADRSMRLTAEGRAAIEALDRAAGEAPAATTPEGLEDLVAATHAQLRPDPDNARTDWDSDDAKAELDALQADILDRGLLSAMLVRPTADTLADGRAVFELIGGERRWRAIGAAIDAGAWPADRPIACRVRPGDDELGRTLDGLADNLLRRDLNPLEEARAYKRLRDLELSTADIADRVRVTVRQVQMRLQLLELPEKDQQRLTLPKDDPNALSVTQARQMLQSRPQALTPPETLLLAEIWDKAHRTSSRWSKEAEVDPAVVVAGDRGATIDDPVFQSLAAKRPAFTVSTARWEDGRASINLSTWALTADVKDWTDLGCTPDAADDAQLARLGRLAQLRRDAGIETGVLPQDGWATAWLNPPHDLPDYPHWPLSEAGLKVAADRAEREKQNAERNAEWKSQRAAREAEAAARQTAAREADAGLIAAIAAPPALEPRPDLIAALADTHPLPWRLSEDGPLDANGEEVLTGGETDGVWRMVLVAVNTFAGLETPPDAAPTDDDDAAEGAATDPEDGE